MPIVQISRIQHRRGKETDLPQLAAGELGWVIDSQKLYIGNGALSDGAPNLGNTEVVTTGSSAFGAALKYLYQGYLEDSSNIKNFATQKTLQTKLDEYISVKDFGAVGDGSTADITAINNAMRYVYRNTDKTDARSKRIVFFPAGTYRIAGSMRIPPYAHLRGEGPGKTIIYQVGGNGPVAVTEDNKDGASGQVFGSIGNGGATTPTQIQIEGICFANGEAYSGLSIDNATHVYLRSCKFQGTYASGGVDVTNSKGVTVRSTDALPCSNIVFDECQFTKFARLVDFSYDVTSVRFNNCDFATAYYGAMLGETMDGSTAGKTKLRGIHFYGNSWSNIGQQAIHVKKITDSAIDGSGPRFITSHGNWYAKDIANNFEGVDSIREVPVLQFDADECGSTLDFFERTDLRVTTLNPASEVQGVGRQTKLVKQITLANNKSTATTTTLEFPALTGKSIVLNYKIDRGSKFRVGQFIVNGSTSNVSYDDTFNESNGDAGITLSAVLDNKDSTAGNETVIVKYTTTNLVDATMDVEVLQLV